jgi:hypothetical protein
VSEPTTDPTPVDATEHGEDAVLLYVGGPLDGRVEVREARHGAPLPTVTHTHLHDGPKVVSYYDLHPLAPSAGVYHLRTAPLQVDQPSSAAR